MSVKICAYCEKEIRGQAVDVTEYSDRGAHPLVWWHKFGDPDCVRARPAAASLVEPHIGGRRIDRGTRRRGPRSS